jgi:hypothetical protein
MGTIASHYDTYRERTDFGCLAKFSAGATSALFSLKPPKWLGDGATSYPYLGYARAL